MVTKTDFSPEEWTKLKDAAHLTALAITASGSSGLWGTIKEGMSVSSSLIEGMQADNPLLRQLCAREELEGVRNSLKARLEELKGKKPEEAKSAIAAMALADLQQAMAMLKSKGASTDLTAYSEFVRGMGRKVAEAAKEGGFLGFGGERISEPERELLARLDTTISAAA
jgi:hypothetical protein